MVRENAGRSYNLKIQGRKKARKNCLASYFGVQLMPEDSQ